MEDARKLDECLQWEELERSFVDMLQVALSSSDETDVELRDQNMFNLASVLARSAIESDRVESQRLFLLLVDKSTNFGRDSLYGVALLTYRTQSFEQARYYIEQLIRTDPDNSQFKTLYRAIKYKHNKQVQQEAREQQAIAIGTAVGIGLAALSVGMAFALGGGSSKGSKR
jgi:predicted Zn-dependent protease